MNINSKSYWESRFKKDWIEHGGEEQSKFFATVILKSLNKPLISFLSRDDIVMIDWGCATGDGTSIFHQHINKNIVGVDFSNNAINKASEKYPQINFKCENWLSPELELQDKYNVLISSNTLEHFDEPFSTLSIISEKIENMLILAVPFEEYERISEHCFTFDGNNLPYIFNNKWILSFVDVIDCTNLNPTYWNGKQIVLVYSKLEWLKEQAFNADFFYNINKLPSIKARLNELVNEI
ncbi:class I SAM-dependent methyltransferase [Photobacterium sp. S4TG1]|uniref:class I SAM-dependent methyltransferase n=1 Tax=Photobacterium sp. S4TG1 TaxID=3114587 RepID=UPI002E186493|nr:class I SAM-dependent methyltransferase [Photobacterium sp. S4TG1]